MGKNEWLILTILCVITAVGLAVRLSRKRSIRLRIVFAALAALAAIVTVGVMRDVWQINRFVQYGSVQERDWQEIRRNFAERSPAFGDVIVLSPAVEKEFKAAILRVVRDENPNNEASFGRAMTAAISNVLVKHVYPVAAHGSTEAVTSWGHLRTLRLQELAATSIEACALYGRLRIVGADGVKDAPLREALYRALIDAYKTTDNAKYPLADEATVRTQYAKAVRIAQPPFTEEELAAFDTLDNQSKERQCALTLRLFKAVDRLDSSSKVVIYRYWMTLAY